MCQKAYSDTLPRFRATSCLRKSHCLTGNLALSASNPSFPPTLHRFVLQGRNVAHQLWSGRST